MSKELKPCPNPACGNKYPELIELAGMFSRVVCHKCGITGKKIESEGDDTDETLAVKAITAWNALPRALVWTTEPPENSGWYFVRTVCPMSGIAGPHVVELFVLGMHVAHEKGYYQWAGPIPEPQEPIRS